MCRTCKRYGWLVFYSSLGMNNMVLPQNSGVKMKLFVTLDMIVTLDMTVTLDHFNDFSHCLRVQPLTTFMRMFMEMCLCFCVCMRACVHDINLMVPSQLLQSCTIYWMHINKYGINTPSFHHILYGNVMNLELTTTVWDINASKNEEEDEPRTAMLVS